MVAKIDTLYRDEQEKLARSVGGANALAMAGALVDDEAPAKATPASASAAAKAAAAASAAKTPCALPNQKLGLLKALLTLGDVTHSLFILAQFPYLVPANLDIADLLNRLLSVAIQPAYNEIALTRSHTDFQAEFQATKPKYVAPDKQRTTTPSRIVTQLTHKPFPDPNKKLLFFFPAWSSCMPKAGDWEEVLTVLEKLFLPLIGVFISRDFSLYTKICRIIVRDLSVSARLTLLDGSGSHSSPTSKDTPDNPRLARWLDLIRQFLLPAISLLSDHTAAALELWKVLALLPIEKRFQLYGEWKDTLYRRIPALAVRKAEAERDVKSILRRLSTENVKKLGKTLAKSAHTNPAITFSVALNQVQSYDNLIVPVVEAARYLTDFGYDVLTYSLLDALASGKSKTKEDGTSVALWLQGTVKRLWSASAPSPFCLCRSCNICRSAVPSLGTDGTFALDCHPISRQSACFRRLEGSCHSARAHHAHDRHRAIRRSVGRSSVVSRRWQSLALRSLLSDRPRSGVKESSECDARQRQGPPDGDLQTQWTRRTSSRQHCATAQSLHSDGRASQVLGSTLRSGAPKRSKHVLISTDMSLT